MSEPHHVHMARELLDGMMAASHGPAVIRETHRAIRERRWKAAYIDSIHQSTYSGWPMEQLAAFAVVHSMIYSGLVAQVPVSTLGPPRKDADREGNAAMLARLPHPFSAWVDMEQSNDVGDGVIEWSEPIEVSLCTGLIEREEGGITYPISLHYMIPPGSALLEIGGSLASRTWTHLVDERGSVARWPYGHSVFRLFINLDFAAMRDRWVESLGIGELIGKRATA